MEREGHGVRRKAGSLGVRRGWMRGVEGRGRGDEY